MNIPDNPVSLPVFGPNDRASRQWSLVEPTIERLHDDFMGQWRQALNAIVPGEVEIDGLDLRCQAYAVFVKEAPPFSDIQVYEVEALQSLAAWSLAPDFVDAAVDTMFGGTGRALLHAVQRRQRSPIESGVRRRLFESMATAYESAWQALHPIRLNPLRQEALLSSLRLTAAAEQVVHARFRIVLNGQDFPMALCMPLRALDVLQPAPSNSLASPPPAAAGMQAGEPEAHVPQRLQDAPLEVVAMLGELQLTVAQLMSLSIGQVLPFQMNEQVPLQVDGVRVVSGRSGVRNGFHAVKVQLSEPVNLQGLKAEFMPLAQTLTASGEASAADATADAPPPAPSAIDSAPLSVASPSASDSEDARHEPDPLQ